MFLATSKYSLYDYSNSWLTPNIILRTLIMVGTKLWHTPSATHQMTSCGVETLQVLPHTRLGEGLTMSCVGAYTHIPLGC